MTLHESRDDAVVDALRDLARAEASIETPPHVEAAVMAAWDESHRAGPGHTRMRAAARYVLWPAAAIAAGVMLVTVSSIRQAVREGQDLPTLPASPGLAIAATPAPPAPQVSDPPIAAARTPRVTGAPAPALVYVGEALAGGEPMRVVRMRVPLSRLEAFGIRPAAAQQTDTVELELLVGEDGVARGLRMAM